MRVIAFGVSVALAGVLVSVSLGARATSATYTCSGKQVTLFDNTNGDLVSSGGAAPTFSTKGKSYCVTYIQTYHWNGGKGQAPGMLGLQQVAGPAGVAVKVGPFAAKASAGQGGAPNVNWFVGVPPIPAATVINGTYRCVDSGAATWSADKGSSGNGFCIVDGVPAKGVKCKCTSVSVSIAPSLFTKPALRADQQDFGVGIRWTMGCTKGDGGCSATVDFAPPVIQAGSLPATKVNLKLDVHSMTFTCDANCGKQASGQFLVKMTSLGQLNKLFGRTLAFTVTEVCNGQSTRQVVRVVVDAHGRFRKAP